MSLLMMRYFKKTAVWAATAGLVSTSLMASTTSGKQPNIVYLMSDDQSTYTLGCYGNPDVRTPEIDQLAADGMVFDNHYDTTAICMASRASVMTGMYEHKHGVNFGYDDMPLDTWKKTYPMVLREAGYQTAFAGKFGFDLCRKRGMGKKDRLKLPADDFDRWGGGPGQTHYRTAKNTSMAAYADAYPHSTLSYGAFGRDFIHEAAKSDKPFCLSISFKAPHKPATPDPEFDSIYKGKTFKKPANYGREQGEHFSEQSKQGRQYARFHEWGYADNYDEVMATYHQQVYAIDVAVGMIRDALEEAGVDQNTVIIYTSDNGYFCGSHGYGSKVLPYEESARVPMIMYDPRNPNSGKQLRSDGLTGNIDFAPTMLSLAGLPVPDDMDGKNLMELYENPKAAIHESLALINVFGSAPTHALAVVTKEMKYIHWGYAAKGFEESEELYHLEEDGLELTNQAGNPEYASALNQMREAYDDHLGRWKAEAVENSKYETYGVLFDRHLPWAEKQDKLPTVRKQKKRKGKGGQLLAEEIPPVHMANGIKMGEVSSSSAIIWTRLTQHAERNVDGKPFPRKVNRKHKSAPVDDLSAMEGSVPGVSGEVRLTYWPVNQALQKTSTDWRAVDANRDFTRQFPLTGLLPGSQYKLLAEGRQQGSTTTSCRIDGGFVTAPAIDVAAPVRFSVVTCQEYPRRDSDMGHTIYHTMHEQNPDFFVHTGDIEYYDKPMPYADTVELARFKWNRIFSLPHQRTFHNHTASYFMKDDHDTLKNDCWPGQTYGDLTWEQGLTLFREQVPVAAKPYRTIRWGKDLQVWLVEGRDFRSPNTMSDGPKKTIWGEEQKQWFFDTVKQSDATFRMLISPTPIVGPDRGGKNDNHANKGFTHEGDELRTFIGKQKNMFIICGDRHWQYVSEDPKTGVREYSCGSASDAHAGGFNEKNRSPMHRYLKVKGGFLSVAIDRHAGQARATFTHHGVDGSIYNQEIVQAERNETSREQTVTSGTPGDSE